MSVAFSPRWQVARRRVSAAISSLDSRPRPLWDVATGTARRTTFAAAQGRRQQRRLPPRRPPPRPGRLRPRRDLGRGDPRHGRANSAGTPSGSTASPSAPTGRGSPRGAGTRPIKLWDPDTGAEVRTIHGHKGFVRDLAFSPDGTLPRLGERGPDVRLWEVATGRELATFHGHTGFVHAVAFHPDGRRIASGGWMGR